MYVVVAPAAVIVMVPLLLQTPVPAWTTRLQVYVPALA